MWADQISSTEDGASTKKNTVAGYTVDDEEPTTKVETEAEEQILVQEPLVETPEVQPTEIPSDGEAHVPAPVVEEEVPSQVIFPVAEPVVEASAPAQDTPVTFPSSDLPVPVSFPTTEPAVTFPSSDNDQEPVSFPSSDNNQGPVTFPSSDSAAPVAIPASSENTPSMGTQSPGVTFQDTSSPARSGTPDLDHDGKRRRTLSTQGIQRLARRLSVSRQNSTSPSLPSAIFNSLKRGDSSKRDSKDSAREDGSLPTPETGSIKDNSPLAKDSPNASVSSDISKAKTQKEKKKDKKKEKKRKSTSQPE